MFRDSHKRARRFTRVAAIAAVTAAAIILSACSGSGGASSANKVLTLATTAPPVSLDPAKNTIYPPLAWYDQLSYDPLIRIDGNGNFVPGLATSWKYTSKDHTTFQVTLRKGVKFSDGDDLNAEAVVKSISYVKKNGSEGPSWISGVTSITANGSDKVDFTLSSPSDQMPFLLSQRVMLATIISPKGVSNPDSLKNSTHGAGPYVLDPKQTIANSSYTYVPNPDYWDKAAIQWNKVIIKVVSSTAAALQATQSGEVDAFFGDASTAKAAAGMSSLSVNTKLTGVNGVNYFDTNGQLAPALGNVNVRQALSYAINRPAIAKGVYGNLAEGNATMTVAGLAGYSQDAAEAFAYDPAKAKQLLAQAGYPSGFSFDVATSADGNDGLIAQAVVADWAKIGVSAKLTTYKDDGQLLTDLLAKKYPVAFYDYGTLPMYVQAKSFFSGGATKYNVFNVTDSQIDQGLAAAAAAATLAEQSTGYQKVLQRAQQQLVWSTNILSAPSIVIYNKKLVTGMDMSVISPTPNIAWMVKPVK
ncbi:ABC transporter substrate-binding protein [Rathayibacter soli]|uniref:ABC transporter substrate-binding protein n=1 Tax=Rathayibacter soli TaxID=3144168 RepID=UPI0027E4C809|nr:ABC transporter substrate-binding protein [Glaciibacter superstes]